LDKEETLPATGSLRKNTGVLSRGTLRRILGVLLPPELCETPAFINPLGRYRQAETAQWDNDNETLKENE